VTPAAVNSKLIGIWHLAGLMLLCGALFFSQLAQIPFFDKGEPREAIVVQRIFLTGKWLFPLKGEAEIPSKPPLFHWFGAMTSAAFGRINEVTVRFPSALFATLGVLIVYFFGRRLFDSEVALCAAVILATSFGYESEAITARVDMSLTFFMTLTLVAFYLLYEGFLAWSYGAYAFYFLVGISVLAKGPVGLLLPGMIIGAFLVGTKRWDVVSRLCFHKGVLLTLAIAISWYGFALIRGGEEFFNRQILHENLARFFIRGEGGSGHQKPFYYFFPYLVLLGLPWSLFLPFVIGSWFRRKVSADGRSLFLILWVVIVFFFFSFSAGKRAIYILPLYPPLALLTGLWLKQVQTGEKLPMEGFGLKFVGSICLCLGFLSLVAFLGFILEQRTAVVFSTIGGILKPKDRAAFSMVADSLPRSGYFIFFLLVSAILWFWTSRYLFANNIRAAMAGLGGLSILTGVLVQGTVLLSIAEARTYKPFVVEINKLVEQNQPIFIYGEGWDYASVVFYSGDRIAVIKGDLESLKQRLRSSRAYYIMGEREWQNLVASGEPVPSIQLKSRGTGPDSTDRIVLVRALPPGEANVS
jgi:4-amino-4-deoxy-L-arabinose transferase-like glycosyltransferase